MKEIAVLFARRDSVYKSIPGCDVYDIDRDARTFKGDLPVIAHPPCRAWGVLRQFAKPRPDEKALALWAVQVVRKQGGVLEHPSGSSLWQAAGLPKGKQIDQWGGFTISVDQFWWGHRARKKSWFYIVGIAPADIPSYPLRFDAVTHVVTWTKGHKKQPRPRITKSEREHTPPDLAAWLVELAIIIRSTRFFREKVLT